MTKTRQRHWTAGTLLALGFALLASAPLAAQQAVIPIPSLQMVPADAATYSVSLRTREQIEIIKKSKAWERLWSLPVVKMGWQMLETEWTNSEGKLAPLKKWYDKDDNADLVRFLGELWEEEVFSYGGKNSADFLILAQELQFANSLAPLAILAKNGPNAVNLPEQRIKVLLQALAGDLKRIHAPDLVFGFKFNRTKAEKVQSWLEKLEKAVTDLAPDLKDRFQTVKIQGSDVRKLVLQGDMIPWDQIPLGNFEDQPGEFDKLVKKIKESKLTIAMTVRGQYLLLSIGPDTAGLESFGAGLPKRMAGRTEMAPLAKFADQRLTDVSYHSKEYIAALTGADSLTAMVKDLVKDSGLGQEKQDKIMKDVKDLTAGLRTLEADAGAKLSFGFLTKRGAEDYTYDWSKNHSLDGSKSLTLLTHVGAQPLGFGVWRGKGSSVTYDFLAQLFKLGHQYFEEFGLLELPDDAAQAYKTFMEDALPLFKRFDQATRKLFLPSLDGQAGIVFDAKLKSRQWSQFMPPAAKELPLPELAVILGIKDAASFRKALQEYRLVYNGLVDAVAKVAPGGIPDIKLSEPKSAKQKAGTLYWYPIPPLLGLDQRIGPAGGLSSRVAVFTTSPVMAQQLLTAIARKEKSGPLASAEKKLAAAYYFNWAGFVDVVDLWVEYGLIQANQPNEMISQVHTAMEILKVLRSHGGVMTIENGVLISHGETIIKDIE